MGVYRRFNVHVNTPRVTYIDDYAHHPTEVEATIKEEGERALFETGVINVHPDLVKLLGKLKYRTSYGQNVLNHSIEVSNLARILADELGLNSKMARRAGLLHDIGKAIDHEIEGSHVEIGLEIAKKYQEDLVCHVNPELDLYSMENGFVTTKKLIDSGTKSNIEIHIITPVAKAQADAII